MEQKRGALARIGITLLNLLSPGLGLLRLGRWRLAVVAYGVGLLVLIFMYAAPPMGFGIFASAILVGLAAYPISMVATWLHSREIGRPQPWYTQWYSIVGVMLLAFGISFLLTDEQQQRYRSFYTPAEGMAPTLPKGDRFIAYMRAPRELRRGDVLMIRAPDGNIYVKRLAALPGDRIAVSNGVVVLNGTPVPQRLVSTETIEVADGTEATLKLAEQLPEEATPHLVYDSGLYEFDNVAEQRVRTGHVFVLGDNRDHSADSRVPHDMFGVEQVPIADVEGWPLFYSFGSSRPMGESINRKDMK